MLVLIDGDLKSVGRWELLLQRNYPFMQQDSDSDGTNIYRKWGFECDAGWAGLLRECCEAIVARYSEDGIEKEDIDFIPTQIKEKYGTLRFYYGFTDAPCEIAAFDNLATGESIRFEPKANTDIDDATAKRRQDIRYIVRTAEEKSKHTCEVCGAEGKLRNDSDLGIHWVRTLCDHCHENRIKKAIEAREKRKKMDDNSGI